MTAQIQDPPQKKAIEKFRNEYVTPNFLVENIVLNFQLSDENTIVHSKMTIIRNLDQTSDYDQNSQLLLNGENLKLLDIKLDNISLPSGSYIRNDNHLMIADLPNKFNLEIVTEINPIKNTSLVGLYKSSGKYCTQCEAEGFRHITYYLDRPDVMAVFTTTIEASKKQYPYLLSNGNLVESRELENDRHSATWHDPFPKPCYLFALVAGDFDLLEDSFTTTSGREVALKIYVDKGKLNQCHYAMASLKKAMTWDQDVYGLEYDLDNYIIVAVSDFNMGAMENKGLNVFNTAYVLANDRTATDADFEGVERVIAHEYFHNWTGNRVTCRDWFQLSLKEGLTVFRDQEFSSDMNSRAVNRVADAKAIKIRQFSEDAGPMAHPIRPDSYIEMNNFYTVTVYNKGAEVIRMMHSMLGEQGFQLGMKRYFQRHDGQAVTCEDFIKAMEDANDVDFGLFRNWYSQAGTPEVVVESDWEPTTGKYSLTFNQECQPTPGQPHKERFLIPIRLALFSKTGDLLKLRVDGDNENKQYTVADSGDEIILKLSERHQTITFNDLKNQPVPSLLRGFSAPVKLRYNYSHSELALLLTHDNDSYTNWDAGQSLMTAIIVNLTESIIDEQPLIVPDILVNALLANLENTAIDPSLLAMSLKTPGLDYLIEQFQQVLFDELVLAYKHLNKYLSEKLKTKLQEVYFKANDMGKQNNAAAIGWRSLQNACLALLAESETDEITLLAIEQFNNSKAMTNSLAALKVVAHSSSDKKESVLDSFYQRWQDEELVLDKWFAVQATNPCASVIDDIYLLLEHADFQLSNPNKIRALIASFAKNNLQNFHRKDGYGYKLVADIIIKLNKINPQIAAFLTLSFNSWRDFDNERRDLMETQLKRLVELDNISLDVYEIATKALA